jgi:hypothetical protein
MESQRKRAMETTELLRKHTVTRSQIRSLSGEAGAAGDLEMVCICDRALGGDEGSIEECALAIKSAMAMHEACK